MDTFVQPIGGTDRGRTDGDADGFVKVHVKRGSDRIVGATIVARHAGELISEITVAMAGGVGLKQLATVIHPYPTQAEAIKKGGRCLQPHALDAGRAASFPLVVCHPTLGHKVGRTT